jgi:hypothetical protein
MRPATRHRNPVAGRLCRNTAHLPWLCLERPPVEGGWFSVAREGARTARDLLARKERQNCCARGAQLTFVAKENCYCERCAAATASVVAHVNSTGSTRSSIRTDPAANRAHRRSQRSVTATPPRITACSTSGCHTRGTSAVRSRSREVRIPDSNPGRHIRRGASQLNSIYEHPTK